MRRRLNTSRQWTLALRWMQALTLVGEEARHRWADEQVSELHAQATAASPSGCTPIGGRRSYDRGVAELRHHGQALSGRFRTASSVAAQTVAPDRGSRFRKNVASKAQALAMNAKRTKAQRLDRNLNRMSVSVVAPPGFEFTPRSWRVATDRARTAVLGGHCGGAPSRAQPGAVRVSFFSDARGDETQP